MHHQFAKVGVFCEHHRITLARRFEDNSIRLPASHLLGEDDGMPLLARAHCDRVGNVLVEEQLHEATCVPIASVA